MYVKSTYVCKNTCVCKWIHTHVFIADLHIAPLYIYICIYIGKQLMYVTYHTPNIYTHVELRIPYVLKKELPSNGIGFPKVSIPQLNQDNRVISIN